MDDSLHARFSRRARLLRSCIRKPSDLWLATRIVGWRMVLPLLKWALPLPRLVRLMSVERPQIQRDPHREQHVIALVYGFYARGLDNCLEHSLLTYRFVTKAGGKPELVVGMSHNGSPRRGHVWTLLDGEPVREDNDPLEEFAPVLSFTHDGAQQAP